VLEGAERIGARVGGEIVTISRRTTLKLGFGVGALPLLGAAPAVARSAAADPCMPDASVRCRPLPLTAVRLTGGPLGHAQDLNGRYLLELDPDRMLAYYREQAGLPPKGEPYSGWDGGGRNLTGHIAGHHLSAVSLMWSATGDTRFKERADYLVRELKVVQDAHGDGYLSAVQGAREAYARLARGDIESESFDLNGLWAPWYTLHKTFAGLRDAYRHTANRVALEMEIAFAIWAERILADLDENQLEHMMNTEFGGMNEIMVDLYADTGDERWLALSRKFEHDDFIVPLKQHRDNLAGKHGNTAIPKLLGSADRFVATGEPSDLAAAAYFWDIVVGHHSFATGGHGKDEYFGPPDRFGMRVDGRTAETCNVYNMLKLTRRLFAISPDARFADFHERALFNHILGSMDPVDGRTCYMVPVGRGVQHEYQDMFESFTCCVGSGMESHALHGDGIYFEDGDRLYVNLYAPSTAEWSQAGALLIMETDFPLGEAAKARLQLREPRTLTLSVRRPYWAGSDFAVRVNGKPMPLPDRPARDWRDSRSQYQDSPQDGSEFVDITREWRDGDTLDIGLPKSLWLEPTPDNPRRAAIMWGPLVLSGDLGPERRRSEGEEREEIAPPPPVPVLVAADEPVDSWIRAAGTTPGGFRTRGVGRLPVAEERPVDVDLVPFYRLHRRTYAAYWDLFTPEEWEAEKRTFAAEAERQRKLEARTVAYLEPGETWFERDFNYRGGDDASSYRIEGRPARRARSWFAYDIPVDSGKALVLIIGFYSDDRRHSPGDFSILIDDQLLTRHRQVRTEPPRFYDVRFPVPEALVQGKDRATLRFQADEDSQIPAIFSIRLVRAPETS
jgi:hypothetical protein